MIQTHTRKLAKVPSALVLPDDEVRGVGGIGDVDGVDIGAVLLADALEHALRARTLDAHRDAGILRFEGFGDLLGERQVDRGVPDDFAFLLRRFDKRGGHGARRRRGREHLRREHAAGRERARADHQVAA
jgi:hypothetical protein